MPTVAYLGPEKTNTHLAALKKFGGRARYAHAPTVEDVFRMVERKKAGFGVVPIENSLEGAVTHTLDRFIGFRASPVKICGEMEVPIQHCLITLPATRLSEVAAVYSHPQALAQCREWLHKHLPGADWAETTSTSEAIGLLLRKDREIEAGAPARGARTEIHLEPQKVRAAIGRGDLARELGLKSVSIPQDRENKTRFLVIGLKGLPKGKRNKTSVMFALKDKPGALHDALVPFKTGGINLSKIESRPTKRRAWEYVFFVDFEGHESEAKVKKVLKELKRRTADLRVLGSYPVGSRS